jgi:hypothetical protein
VRQLRGTGSRFTCAPIDLGFSLREPRERCLEGLLLRTQRSGMKRDVGTKIRQALSFFRSGTRLIGKDGFLRLQGRNALEEVAFPTIELFRPTGQLDVLLVGLALPLGQVVM